ncbi:MAG: peroxidase [Alphaproteobacteria bacterium]|nr:peroxidase [Alphaproteobacteria bacterium]
MFLLPGHGTAAVHHERRPLYHKEGVFPDASAFGFSEARQFPPDPTLGGFGYLFPDAPDAGRGEEDTHALDALSDAMLRAPGDPDDNAFIAPVFTFFGQFIDHDITAIGDRDAAVSVIDTDRVAPIDRGAATHGLRNLRSGALTLECIYGGGPMAGDVARRLHEALRSTEDPAKLALGDVTPDSAAALPPDECAGRDLLRLGDLIATGRICESDLRALPAPMRDLFVRPDGQLRLQRAILGDMRNDANLPLAQFHLAIVRLHNRIVDCVPEDVARRGDAARFAWARRMTTWHIQWLALYCFLPAICDQDTLGDILISGPLLYRDMVRRHAAPDGRPAQLPLPMEFSFAAFRFGHTTLRDRYDWNAQFGRSAGQPIMARAPFNMLFAFTGGADDPMPRCSGGNAPSLPAHLLIDWGRFVHQPSAAMPDRSARKIDTHLALPLRELAHEEAGDHSVLRHLARRNLRRGHRMNLACAQECLAAMAARGIELPALTPAQLASGETGAEIRAGGFDRATPLWFYVLKEAEVLQDGRRLGPLGTWLVADTILGLITHDPHSFWNTGTGNGSWHPRDGVRPDGIEITSMASMMEAAGVLA